MTITYVFVCKRCGLRIMSDKKPSDCGCSSKTGLHQWLRTRV